jgi:hypothetical protein
MLMLQEPKKLPVFSHARRGNGMFLSICDRDGWRAASAQPENLRKAEDAHVQSSCRLFEHIVLSNGQWEWICLWCGAAVLSTSEAELAEAKKSHRCAR